MLKDSDFGENAAFFQMCFEIGRRYKILNPERMRDTYGKLIYLLMDSQKPEVSDLLDFECVTNVRTVFETLKLHKGSIGLLEDPLLKVAVGTIATDGKSRHAIDKEIRAKNAAVKTLAQKYSTVKNTRSGTFFRGVGYSFGLYSRSSYERDDEDKRAIGQDGLTEDDVEQCIYSLGDHQTYLQFNRDPVCKMIYYLEKYFSEDAPDDDGLSLSISSG